MRGVGIDDRSPGIAVRSLGIPVRAPASAQDASATHGRMAGPDKPTVDWAERAAASTDLTPAATRLAAEAPEPAADPNGLAVGARWLVAGAADH